MRGRRLHTGEATSQHRGATFTATAMKLQNAGRFPYSVDSELTPTGLGIRVIRTRVARQYFEFETSV